MESCTEKELYFILVVLNNMQIQHRALTDEGVWIEGNYLKFEHDGEFHHLMYIGGHDFWNFTEDLVNIDVETLSMFTGKFDTNKKKIFAGDIVEGNFPYASRGVIVWDYKRCGFFVKPISRLGKASYDKYYKMSSNKLTIIGNEWDNPELLTVKI